MYNITPENSLKLVEALEQEGFDLEEWENLHTRVGTGLYGEDSKWLVATRLVSQERKLEKGYCNAIG